MSRAILVRAARLRVRLTWAACGSSLALASVGCTRAREVDHQITIVQRNVQEVLSSGGYTCAPRELALAQSELEFARSELAQGKPRDAERHVRDAELNAKAAARLSPAVRCAGAQPVVQPIPRTEEPDRDHDGIADVNDACPDEAEDLDGYQDMDGCPDPDNDGDGIPDRVDRCPNQAEDIDGYQDTDGCPEPDSDHDGVPDAIDHCASEAGTAANAGCPALHYKGVEVTPHALRIVEPILFEDETATIRSVSFPVLDTIVQVLAEHREITLEIQGHTDSLGDNRRNLKLSQNRAQAVMAYLVQRGVSPTRLTAQGYGETRPIESNRTSQGRDINRRIEFVRTDATP